MDSFNFRHFLASLGALSLEQRHGLGQALKGLEHAESAVERLEAQFLEAPKCPHCAHERLYRQGRVDGLQRYRCLGCRKTFNALTGTPLRRLRHKSKWLPYLKAILDSLTVRAVAREVSVHRTTSFRWRHRFLDWVKEDRPSHMQGITEADETYMLESMKGSRELPRPARKRGEAAKQRGTSKEQVCILVARDRSGQTLDIVTGRGPVSKAQLHECLAPVLDRDGLLVSDGNPSYHYFAKEQGITHEAVTLKSGVRVRGAFHVQNVNAYHRRLRGWMERFHGVATFYLPNYLGWRRALDTHRLNTPADLLLAAVGVFPHLMRTVPMNSTPQELR